MIALLLLSSAASAQTTTRSVTLPSNPDPRRPAKQITVHPAEAFILKSGMAQTIMIALGKTSDGNAADLKVQFKAGTGVFLTMIDGKWKAVGPGGSAIRAEGRKTSLRRTSFKDGEILWRFGHSLKPGETCTVFQKKDKLWIRVALINCRKTE